MYHLSWAWYGMVHSLSIPLTWFLSGLYHALRAFLEMVCKMSRSVRAEGLDRVPRFEGQALRPRDCC